LHLNKHGARAPSPPSGGEGWGEGVFPRVAHSAFVEAPLTPTLSPQERGEGARAGCDSNQENP